MKHWSTVAPLLAAALLVAAAVLPGSGPLSLAAGLTLVGAVLAAVLHAEVVAHRVGEPLGTLVLALAVTVIETSLIVSLMLAGGPEKAELARDTVYAAVMIICNGVIGLCVLMGGIRHHEQTFRIEGAGPAFAALVALATLVLVLPAVTTSAPGPAYTPAQLTFAGLCSLVLWGVFVFVQTIRHRDYFLPPAGAGEEEHLPPPTARAAWMSLLLLLVSLVGVVGLAKVLSPSIEGAVRAAGAPDAVIGIAIALLVLLPETVAAVRAALANRLQTSMNLALGSALATIGLTIPAVVVASQLFHLPVVLGLDPKDLVLLLLTFLVGTVTLGPGRTGVMQGAVQLVVFVAFLFLSLVP
ncbi:MAG: ionic transporter y4hA [Myxococcaceae bacterium]|nr:MAG: ionic transporter y4hA [Myxococcaceae bacterium]